MEVPLKGNKKKLSLTIEWVSNLVLMEVPLKVAKYVAMSKENNVSNLVLMEVPLKVVDNDISITPDSLFQTLF